MIGEHRPRRVRRLARIALAGLLGVAAIAALSACGDSAKGLIPAGQAGPLLGDFEAVQRAAENAGGNCSETDSALRKTEADYAALASTVNAGLRTTLRQGIENLTARAHELCTQPAVQTSTTTTQKVTSTPATPPTTTTTTTTSTTPPITTTEEAEREREREEQSSEHEKAGGVEAEEKSEHPSGGVGGKEGPG